PPPVLHLRLRLRLRQLELRLGPVFDPPAETGEIMLRALAASSHARRRLVPSAGVARAVASFAARPVPPSSPARTTALRPRPPFASAPGPSPLGTSSSSSSPRRTAWTDADAAKLDEFLSSLTPARRKLYDILNEYKAANFEHATPHRFFSMMVKAVDANSDGVITPEEFDALLDNIGAGDGLTEDDKRDIFEEVGTDDGSGGRVIEVEGLAERWTPYINVMWKPH
ncbi:hypothetical protein ACHAWF_001774, partial [Thalassiosira exigua]